MLTLLWPSHAAARGPNPATSVPDRPGIVVDLASRGRFRNSAPSREQCLGEVEDAALLDGARRGNADAVSILFGRYQGPIFRYAAHMCGRDAADDVVQDTFLAVLRGSGQYDANRGPVVNYLFGIARHFVLKRLGMRERACLESDWEDNAASTLDAPTIVDSLTREETIAAVRLAIRSLPPAYREAIVLCELQEMTYEAAAAVAACPVGTIRSRLHRAKSLLTAKLSVARADTVSQR